MDEWIKKQWDKYQPEIIGGIILTILLAIGTGFWAMAQTWAGPLIIPLVLGVFALGLLATNQIHIIRERNKKAFTNQSDEKIEATIQKWLVDDLGYKFQKKINDECLFQFEVVDEGGRNISISRSKIHPTRLDISSARVLGEEHREKYEKLNQSEKQDVVHNLRMEMARFGLLFKSFDTNLQRIDFGDSVSLDDTLTEFYLKQRILFMIRASFLINEVIRQALN